MAQTLEKIGLKYAIFSGPNEPQIFIKLRKTIVQNFEFWNEKIIFQTNIVDFDIARCGILLEMCRTKVVGININTSDSEIVFSIFDHIN